MTKPETVTAGDREIEPMISCGYQGYEFGATSYPDSICGNGWLWDADSFDHEDGSLSHGGDIACPRCNTAQFIADAVREAREGGYGVSMYTPWCSATVFEAAMVKAIRENRSVAEAEIAKLPDFVVDDWPDRGAVYDGRARWTDTTPVHAGMLIANARALLQRIQSNGGGDG